MRIKVLKNKQKNLSLIFHPAVCYFFGFIIPFLLTTINFTHTIYRVSEETEMIIWGSVFSFYLSGFFYFLLKKIGNINRQNKRSIVCIEEIKISNKKFVYVFLLVWFFIGLGCLFFEFYKLGEIPLFSDNIETIRFKVQYNGYVHFLAISNGVMATIAFVCSKYENNLGLKIYLYLLSFLAISSLFLTGNRSDSIFFIAIATVFVIMSSKNIITLRNVLTIVLTVLVFVAINYYRQISNGEYVALIQEQLTGNPNPLRMMIYPFYMTLTYGYMIFDRLVLHGVSDISHGVYTFYSIISLFTKDYPDFGVFKNEILGIEFYAELTSTYISNFYVDYGEVGAYFGSFVLGFVLFYFHGLANRKAQFIPLYAVLYLHYLLFFYMYIYIYLLSFFQVIGYMFFCYLFLRSKNNE